MNVKGYITKSIAALTLLSLTTACAPEWSKPVADPDQASPQHAFVCIWLPQERVLEATVAVQTWDLALMRWRRFIPVPAQVGDACTYNVYESDGPAPDGDQYALAWTSTLGGHDIFMRKGWYEFDTTKILMHEMGHALGAQHVWGTMMNPTIDPNALTCPDVTTVAQIAAFNHIPLTELAWCRW